MTRPRILFVIAEDWYFWSHRRNLARHLRDLGCVVGIATPVGEYESRIRDEGFDLLPFQIHRASRNPLREILTIARLYLLFVKYRPDLVHVVGIKPILYGRLAAVLARVPATVCAVCGLGWVFQPGGRLKKILRAGVRLFYRRFIRGRSGVRVVVQNADDYRSLVSYKMANEDQLTRVNGAGVDMRLFPYSMPPAGVPVVITHCRMLWDKGVGEMVEAAREIRRRGIACRFLLVGAPDPANPAAIPEAQLLAWQEEGVVEWLGYRTDIPDLLRQANIACLPSYYREGMPLSLIEAASCGLPIVTADSPGCREVVIDGENGLLVPPRDPMTLADRLVDLIENAELRVAMGLRGRELVRQSMCVEIVNDQMVDVFCKLLGERWVQPKQFKFGPVPGLAAVQKAA
jgi:glycosyltransferase involved in cell wall biosynthesis